MDPKLLAWARAVKARRRARHPVLWLFTDSRRQPNPLPAIARLPAGLCGVVFRHDGVPGRAALARRIAILCRRRRLALSVAGDASLAAAIGAAEHLRHRPRPTRRAPRGSWVTAAAHDAAAMRRAIAAGADLLFLSPAFPTRSHPGATPLGARGWAALARSSPVPVLALGGVDGCHARALPARFCAGAGAISAFADNSILK